jgi:hypothetical protein
MAEKKPQRPPDPEREARLQRILQEIEKQLRHSLPELDQPLEQIEQESQEIGRQVQEIVERETLEGMGTGYLGSYAPCACGERARFVTQTPRVLVTLNGVRHLQRAYYHCAACRKGFCPLDRQLELGAGESSVGVRALCARFASYLPFRKAAEELECVCGVRLSAGTVRREAEAVGQALAAEWAEKERRLWAGEAPAPQERPARLQIGMDGVILRIGKEGKEVKLGEVYRPKVGGGVERIRYYATRAGSEVLGRRLRTLGQEEGASYCRHLGTIGDGIDWIWQEAAKHFPRSDETLDYFHAMEHLWEAAHAQFGRGEEAAAWIDQQQERLLDQEAGVEAVIAAVGAWEPGSEEAAGAKRRLWVYLERHAHRMGYQQRRAQGYHIGSGVVEAGCKNVVAARLRGVGMRWSEAGAEAMLHLRAEWCSTGCSDFRPAARAARTVS